MIGVETAMLPHALLLLALAAAPADLEKEVREAEKSWAAAVAANDFPKLEKVLSAQLIYAHSTGVIETKAQYMGRLRKGAQRYEGIDHEKLTVYVYGNTAVAHSHVRMRGTSDGRRFDDRLMMMHVWVKQAGAWQLVAHQTTKLT